ncbi:hypothetical protein [Hungatella effluvii]|uniref:hypothetical protein n=1 Tax=Hungatella effluvii TaxID=1096246 RepID=UPI002A7F8E7D|nr:hypothetical protein [Hungatella effluvii]
MKGDFKRIFLIVYALAKGTANECDNKNCEYQWWRQPLYEYLMEQDKKIVESVRTIMYVGRAVYTGEKFTGEKEEVYNTYNLCAKGSQEISAREICSKTPLHKYLKCGYEYFELDILKH